MENKPANVEDLFEKLKEYADIRVNLFKLKSIHKISGFMSSVIASLVLVILLCALLLCVTIGVALLIGALIGKTYLGFFIVAGIYLIVGLVFYSNRGKLIKTPISNKLIKELIDENNL
jgi:Putative Actinobacterial Holin-X, holin superfamily III